MIMILLTLAFVLFCFSAGAVFGYYWHMIKEGRKKYSTVSKTFSANPAEYIINTGKIQGNKGVEKLLKESRMLTAEEMLEFEKKYKS